MTEPSQKLNALKKYLETQKKTNQFLIFLQNRTGQSRGAILSEQFSRERIQKQWSREAQKTLTLKQELEKTMRKYLELGKTFNLLQKENETQNQALQKQYAEILKENQKLQEELNQFNKKYLNLKNHYEFTDAEKVKQFMEKANALEILKLENQQIKMQYSILQQHLLTMESKWADRLEADRAEQTQAAGSAKTIWQKFLHWWQRPLGILSFSTRKNPND